MTGRDQREGCDRIWKKGSVLIEAGITFFLVLLVLGFNLEIIRRSQNEVLLQYGAFLYTRYRVLGASLGHSGEKIRSFFMRAVGNKAAIRLLRSIHFEETICSNEFQGKLHLRYASLMRFPMGNQTKHHFEITRSCIFPF